MKVLNKFTGEDFTEVTETGLKESRDILSRGIKASSEIAQLPLYSVHDALMAISQEIRKNTIELARIITVESGKPIRNSRVEVDRASRVFAIAAEEATRAGGETIPFDTEERGLNRLAFYNRLPLGLIYSITAFSDPLSLAAHKIAPALATRNAIINKPSSMTPVSAMKLGDMVSGTELPGNVVQNVLSPGGSKISNFFLDADSVRMVTFTGSHDTAEKITRKAGVKKLIMELGNNSPVIVWDDADLDSAATSVVEAAFESQGQNCIRPQRILVRRQSYEYFRNRVIELTSNLKVGDPMDENTDIGPMINENEAARVENEVLEARRDGADLIIGGGRDGCVFYPTILENVSLKSNVWKKEIFGPVLNLKPVDSFEEAIEISNDVEYGLQAGVFTSDMNLALTAIERLKYGTVLVNETSNFRLDSMPFGGMKKSGIGREGIRYSMNEMSEIKLAIIKR